jgi:hypothetical protein
VSDCRADFTLTQLVAQATPVILPAALSSSQHRALAGVGSLEEGLLDRAGAIVARQDDDIADALDVLESLPLWIMATVTSSPSSSAVWNVGRSDNGEGEGRLPDPKQRGC